MFKYISFILGNLFFASVAYAQVANKEFKKTTTLEKNFSTLEEFSKAEDDCAAPSADDIIGICDAIYNKEPGTLGSAFAFKFEEYLWEFSCIKPSKSILENADLLKAAHLKIQTMWNNNRKRLKCTGFPLPDANITNFSVNSGLLTFLRASVKRYKLDMNFKDENQKTVMDYIVKQIERYKQADQPEKVLDLEMIYKVLNDNGAKHGKDL
jgi:hypothetical protein